MHPANTLSVLLSTPDSGTHTTVTGVLVSCALCTRQLRCAQPVEPHQRRHTGGRPKHVGNQLARTHTHRQASCQESRDWDVRTRHAILFAVRREEPSRIASGRLVDAFVVQTSNQNLSSVRVQSKRRNDACCIYTTIRRARACAGQ